MPDARVLTVRQPWAWAIVQGAKDVENRSWRTSYRGALLIHAGQTVVRHAYAVVERLTEQSPPAPADITRGAIIGVVELVDCVTDADSPWADEGQWHWLLRDARPIQPAFPCPGRLNLWPPPPDLRW